MKLIQRVGYYLGGFSLGLIILAFFLNGKKTSCDYGPDARVLKNINLKQIQFSEHIDFAISNKKVDSLQIRELLKFGDIDFSNSDTRKKPCGIYAIEGIINESEVYITVENCDSIATIKDITWP